MNDYRAFVECDYNSIYHHGIKGQKWGQRRFQNEDGTLTSAGKARYLKPSSNDSSVTRKVKEDYNSMDDKQFRSKYQVSKKTYAKRVEKYGDPYKNRDKIARDAVVKGVAVGVAAVAAVGFIKSGAGKKLINAGKEAVDRFKMGDLENGKKGWHEIPFDSIGTKKHEIVKYTPHNVKTGENFVKKTLNTFDDLKRRHEDLKKRSDETLKNMEDIANETRRYAEEINKNRGKKWW